MKVLFLLTFQVSISTAANNKNLGNISVAELQICILVVYPTPFSNSVSNICAASFTLPQKVFPCFSLLLVKKDTGPSD